MDILFLSPGFPSEIPEFVRGLSVVGARVWGVGVEPVGALPDTARKHLHAYLQVPSLLDEMETLVRVRRWLGGRQLDRVEALTEYQVVLAARLREALGIPGMSVAQAEVFRDKEKMKLALDAAGVRTPRHARASTVAQVREAAERIGFPLINKPMDGAGSAHTFRCNDAQELDAAIDGTRHVPQVSVEEFIDGEEFTFDTLTAGGVIQYHNIAWYRPRPLVARTQEWISPQVIALRDVDQPHLAGGVAMGRRVIEVLGFQDGFTHMEWYKKPDGEVVFGEIGGRPPGARQVDQMNYACDFDSFVGWAEVICQGTLSQRWERKYNVATVFKRAHGQGKIVAIAGLQGLRQEFGQHIVWENLLRVGDQRRNWLQTLLSDGFLVVRHPDLATTVGMADRIGRDLRLYAR